MSKRQSLASVRGADIAGMGNLVQKLCDEMNEASIESPIEKLFFMAFLWRYSHWGIGIPIRIVGGMDEIDSQLFDGVTIVPQGVLFKEWPVDFVIVTKCLSETVTIAVECDGHEFHERTPAQAERDRQRDRELQQRGCKIFRFTGRELTRDALKHAQEVVDEIEQFVVHGRAGRHSG